MLGSRLRGGGWPLGLQHQFGQIVVGIEGDLVKRVPGHARRWNICPQRCLFMRCSFQRRADDWRTDWLGCRQLDALRHRRLCHVAVRPQDGIAATAIENDHARYVKQRLVHRWRR